MTEAQAEDTSEIETKDKEFKAKVRWVIPHRLDHMTFVGKDVLAVAYDIYITFLSLRNNSELVYVANSEKRGDGVDAIAGHRSNIFAFAEKVKQGRIFVATYPSFVIMSELRDEDVNRYKGLCMMECDLIAGFSGFPKYTVSVWSWRTNQRLLSIPTGVMRRNQIYMASRTHMLVCECWGEGLVVWEVAQCYKRCLMMRRGKEEVTGWEISEPRLVGVCWSSEGQLYAVDSKAKLYSVLSDGINMVTHLEFYEEQAGSSLPCICAFGNGLLIYGPDKCIRSLKKAEASWKVACTHILQDEVVRLVSNSTMEAAVAWTDRGFVYKLTGDEDHVVMQLFTFKQRYITKVQLIAPEYTHVATIDGSGVLCIYEVLTAKLVLLKHISAKDVSFQASPVEPLLVVYGEVGANYGMELMTFHPDDGLNKASEMCLTHQIVSQVVFSPTGRELVAAAMSAGHIFILKISEDYKLTLVRYAELGRGLADCFLMKVGETMRSFSLVLFSDKYSIGERIICINAETGKDNKFAGKMQGPYARLLPLLVKDTMLAIPHLAKHYHILKLSGEKGVTVSVKMGPIIESGHDIKYFNGFFNFGALITYGFDGTVILRKPSAPEEYEVKHIVSHRYSGGIRQACIDVENQYIVHVGDNRTCACLYLREGDREGPTHQPPPHTLLDEDENTLYLFSGTAKNYLELVEEKRIHEEAMDYKRQRDEVVRQFEAVQARVVDLLEQNLKEQPLHQLSLAEFNLHAENKKERLKQGEKERELIRLQTEARIRAQDKVTLWIKQNCWDTMLSPRIKLYAIFSHYQVENYAVLPTQRDRWPELLQIEALRGVEMENDADVFRPWEETEPQVEMPREKTKVFDKSLSVVGPESVVSMRRSADDRSDVDADADPDAAAGHPHVLAGTGTHHHVPVPHYMVPQTRAYSFLHMNWLQHIVKLNVQLMRLWFNKQFDELMNQKKREVGLVEERNARLRFIIEELNKLSDLRGSFHHLTIEIKNPQWQQEEQPHRLIKVEPEECTIEPYISPSQIVLVPPDPGPKDDFKERALVEMMDGVLEKLWHEEIKKPIPMPQCMLDKDPEHFNEDELRLVFEYEAKVSFRIEERAKYRKMLHAEYAKLSQLLNEGIVKFNMRVKDTWLTKLKVDSVIGQENLNLMRLRRTNLDRLEMDEKLESMRDDIKRLEKEVEQLTVEQQVIQEQGVECQAAYEALAAKDRHMDRTFKNHYADLSPIIVDQCYKFFRKRPKWHQRGGMTPDVVYELAGAVLAAHRPPLMHPDSLDYYKGVDQLDLISNMPPVMDEGLWVSMCKLRRIKIENEIRMRAVGQEMAYIESANGVWNKAIQARRTHLANTHHMILQHRDTVELTARNKTIQLVLPAGQVEITTTGHMEDYEDATLIPREDIEKINDLILKVGAMKLRMMRKQMEFRKGILAKEWEHAQMKMKLRHMEQELHSYQRLKIPKELQLYLKNKEAGHTDEMDYVRLEKEMEASKVAVNKLLDAQVQRVEELEIKIAALENRAMKLESLVTSLNLKVSEKRLNEDPLEPIRIRRILMNRMTTLVQRSKLIREVQANHTTIVLLQTELELLRLKIYPTLATFRTI